LSEQEKIDNTPVYRSIGDAERPELERQIREATPGATDADVEGKVAELKASGIVVSSTQEPGKLLVYQQREMRTVADALANLKPPAPKRETQAEQAARVLAEWNAGGNPGPKPKTDADAEVAARQARTDAFMATYYEKRRANPHRKYHPI